MSDRAPVSPTALRPSLFRPAADVVAPQLLGHFLLRRTPHGLAGGVIVEVEAYLHDDAASHSFRGASPRNRAMFGPPGRSYVYLIYGMHHCVNAVCRAAGVGEAVLIRALAPEFSVAWMRKQRSAKSRRNLTNGPAKLCAALDITRELNGFSPG